jgi:hypothetical protein
MVPEDTEAELFTWAPNEDDDNADEWQRQQLKELDEAFAVGSLAEDAYLTSKLHLIGLPANEPFGPEPEPEAENCAAILFANGNEVDTRTLQQLKELDETFAAGTLVEDAYLASKLRMIAPPDGPKTV